MYFNIEFCGSGSAWIRIILRSWIRIRVKSQIRIRNICKKADPYKDPHQSHNSGAAKAQNRAMEGNGLSQTEAWRLKMEQILINLMRIRNTRSIKPKMLFIEKVLIDVVNKNKNLGFCYFTENIF